MHTVKFNGKPYLVSKGMFYVLSTVMGCFFVGMLAWVIYMAYLSSTMASYYTGLNPFVAFIIFIVFLGSVTVTIKEVEEEKAIFPKFVRTALTYVVFFSTLYYLMEVKNWTLMEIFILSVPAIYSKVFKLIKYFK